jgi:hypothetical protein
MPDDPNVITDDTRRPADVPAFALRFQGRKRVLNTDEIRAEIFA